MFRCSLLTSLDDLGSAGDAMKPTGTIGGPCFANDTCNTGLVCVASVCEQPDAADDVPAVGDGDVTMKLSITLNGQQEVPPVTASGSGGPATLVLDETTATLSGTISYSSLTGTPTAAHIHLGDCGGVGSVLYPITVTGTKSGTLSVSLSSLSAADVANFKAAKTYLNVNTVANASGEIRGQLLPNGYTCP